MYFSLKSCTAWNMATMFSMGVWPWMLCTVLNTKPPPGEKIFSRYMASL